MVLCKQKYSGFANFIWLTIILLWGIVISGLIIMIFSEQLVTAADEQPEFDLTAKSALLMEIETGAIIYQKNPHQKLPPASMTKIMTMLLVMEALDAGQVSLDEIVLCSEYAASMGGSQIWLEPGEEMILENLMKAIAIASANDASVMAAEYIAGTETAFVNRMNARAAELGMENTYYYNTCGLPPDDEDVQGTYTTAYDLAIVSRELLKYPEFLQWTSTWIDYLRDGKSVLNNTNRLVRHYPGADGIKTGYTSEAKFCLTATATRDNLRFIAVVMGVDNSQTRFNEITRLLSYGFSTYQAEIVAEEAQVISEIEIINAAEQKVNIIIPETITVPVKRTSEGEINTKIQLNKNIKAPLEKGAVVGKMQVYLNDEFIKEIELVTEKEVNQISLIKMIPRLLNYLVRNLVEIFSP